MKSYNETRVNVTGVVVTKAQKDEKGVEREMPQLNPDGTFQTEDLNNITEKKFQELVDEHKKAGWPEPQPTKIQTFQLTEIEDIAEFETYLVGLGLDPAVAKTSATGIVQRGWAIDQMKEIRDFMSKSEAVEGVVSVAADAATPAERRVKDPLQTAVNALKKTGLNISLDDLKNLIQQFQPAAVAQ